MPDLSELDQTALPVDCEHEWHVDPLRVMVYQGEAHRLAACSRPGCFRVAVVPHDYTTAIPLHSNPEDWPKLPKRLIPAQTAREHR